MSIVSLTGTIIVREKEIRWTTGGRSGGDHPGS
jgi:hypothetical protein